MKNLHWFDGSKRFCVSSRRILTMVLISVRGFCFCLGDFWGKGGGSVDFLLGEKEKKNDSSGGGGGKTSNPTSNLTGMGLWSNLHVKC